MQKRRMLIAATSLLLAGCAPSNAPRIGMPTPAALRPIPELPESGPPACPAGSGFATCFTPAQEAVRQSRYRLLHEDRDYCREAYERAVKNAVE